MPDLELSAPRRISLHDRGHAFTITCRRIEAADWLAYFGAIAITSEQQGAQRISSMDFDTPRLLLAARVITAASGYKVEGGAEIETLPNWVERMPLSHRRQVAATLADVRPSASVEEFTIRAEGEEVTLDAAWSIDEQTGKMIAYAGMKHIFKTPTQAQQKRYNQAASRSVVVGGSRTGRTIYTGAQELLCELYDELVLSVEGYGWHGAPLTGVGDIRNYMDAHHKFSAAQELFNPSGTVSTEAETE